MALSQPRAFFGVHSFTPYSRTDGSFYGTLKVLKGSSLSMQGETVDLMGGSNKFPWAVEDAAIKTEMSLKPSEYPDFLFTLFLGKAPTANAAEATGNVSTAVNKKGSSIIAATGLVGVTALAASEADMKFGKYFIKAVTSTTIDVYFSSDADLGRGTDGTYQNDLLKITVTPLTISTGAVVNVPSFGIKVTGGASATAFVVGDTATFNVRPINSASMTVVIGGAANQTFPEFGAIVMAQKRGNDEMLELDCYRCKGAGFPLGFEMNAWSEADIKVKCFYDSTRDGVFEVRHVIPA